MHHVPLTFQCIYMEAVMKKMKMGMGRMGVRFLEEEEREWRLLSVLYADDMVL